jgi:nucleoside 2-deoxyribosyltransferase
VRIYFAGPLFTPYERAYIDDGAVLLRADGFEVCSPTSLPDLVDGNGRQRRLAYVHTDHDH